MEDLNLLAHKVARRALDEGALRPIETTVHHVEQAGARFVVRMLAGRLGRSAAADRLQRSTIEKSGDANPFLPYDPALFVANLSDTHLCLLNKYPVVDRHLLVVTRAFEEQETLLTLADFEAILVCARQMEGLAFYNSGKLAGASQRHKHLQLAPFPLDPTGADTPIAALLGSPGTAGRVTCSPRLPFRHALLWLPPQEALNAAYLVQMYAAMLVELGISDGCTSPKPYNWLATRQWMLVAPRRAETVGGMAVNSLGFAGSLLVRSAAQLTWLRAFGPLCALRSVSEPLSSDSKLFDLCD